MCKLVSNLTTVWERTEDEERHAAARTWTRIAAPHTDSDCQQVRASLSAVIATVRQAGLDPSWPTKWITKSGQTLEWSKRPVEKATALEHLREGLMCAEWRIAAEHYCGEGLESGQPPLRGYAAARKHLVKNGMHEAARLLAEAVAGGAAIGERMS